MDSVNASSLLFLSANTPWVYSLAEALAERHAVHASRFYDLGNYRRLRPQWPSESAGPTRLTRTICVLPAGYAGRLELAFRPYIRMAIRRWHKQLHQRSGVTPWIIAPYPYLTPWVRELSEKLIYYNLDDYVLYQPARAKKILEYEDELITSSQLTLCLSLTQTSELRKRHPQKAANIHHFPLGVCHTYINPDALSEPQPMTVGYIGNLIERIDWQLVYDVAHQMPDVTFIFVGSLEGFAGGVTNNDWQTRRAAVLKLPNVIYVGELPQREVVPYYWSFAVNWIPYATEHPFNQASCPTKIMDGLATGRPVISSAVPECCLYSEWITIFHNADEAVQNIHRLLVRGQSGDVLPTSAAQLDFARQNTWQQRARTLEAWL